MSSPQVSIVVPAYNSAQFLPDAIGCVLAQTFTDWELLIVNNNSTDHTVELVESYCQQDSRIRLVKQTQRGLSVTRNLGIQESRGEFIGFLDADDIWLPDKLAQHIVHLQSDRHIGVSFSRVELFDPDSRKTWITTGKLTGIKAADFLYENPTTTPSNWVVRRNVFDTVGLFSPKAVIEDIEWLFRVCAKNEWQVEGIKPILTRYRSNSNGLSADLVQMEWQWNRWIEGLRSQYPELIEQHFSLAQAVHLRYLARRAVRLKQPPHVGVDLMQRAIRSDWRLFLHHPHRTWLSAIAVYGNAILSFLNPRSIAS